MMESKVGSKVEVLSKKVAIGMWRSAEIVEINGDEYVVRYDAFRGASRMGTFQRVSSEWIRPCPPPTKAGTSWETGDVVEVYDAGFWKVAMIMKAIGEGKYCIRLIGAVEELEVHNSSLRARLAWEDNRWFVMIQAHQTVMQPGDTAAILRSKFEVLPSRKQKRMSLNDTSNREGYGFKRRKVSSLFQKPPSPRYSCPLNVEKDNLRRHPWLAAQSKEYDAMLCLAASGVSRASFGIKFEHKAVHGCFPVSLTVLFSRCWFAFGLEFL
ncbi:hypothetical protein Droror1_Dr00002650 [Drosera rotundifolia]